LNQLLCGRIKQLSRYDLINVSQFRKQAAVQVRFNRRLCGTINFISGVIVSVI